jgi:sugar phosphate isomerase/epimerase
VTSFASTAALPGTADLWDRLDEYTKAGIAAVELGAGISLAETETDALVARLEARGLRYLVHNYFPPPRTPFFINLASAEDATRTMSIELVERALTLSSRVHAPHYSVHAGWVTDPVGRAATSLVLAEPTIGSAAAAMDRFARSLDRLLGRAEACEVDLLVENNVCTPELRGKVLFADPGDFHTLFARVGCERLGVLADVGHLNVSATTLGFERGDFIEGLSRHIRAFHVHDNDGLADTHQPVTETSWALDVLRRPEFGATDVIDEGHYPDAEALAAHLGLLERETGRTGAWS